MINRECYLCQEKMFRLFKRVCKNCEILVKVIVGESFKKAKESESEEK